MNYAVIMAGGTGKRLWPLSRKTRPKQVLPLFEGQTLIRRCFDRLLPVFDKRNIIVFTNAGYADLIREELTELPFDNVIAEPAVRDTAGAIGLAATILTKYDPNATMAIVTADQVITPENQLQKALKDSLKFVKKNPDKLLTFGIQPTSPSTQLGYIKLGRKVHCAFCKTPVYAVEAFREKPDRETAQDYIRSENYLWNSGMFVWKASTILRNLEEFAPQTVEPLQKIRSAWDGPNQQQVLEDWFIKLPKISIDYAVMEKAEQVNVIKLNCRWIDLGSFAALADFVSSDKNNNVVVAGLTELLDSKNNVIATEDKNHLIATIGMENTVIAHTPDVTLVCHADQTHRLKELLEKIRKTHGEEFL